MKPRFSICLACCLLTVSLFGQSDVGKSKAKQIDLSISKQLQQPIIGQPQRTNSFPTALALSPDAKYLAILNNGRGTAESNYDQSIAILNLSTNELRDFPDPRLKVNARQTYFCGLAWSSDGKELYASIASLTDPEGNAVDAKGKKLGGIGNGIAVYKFADGALTADRFHEAPDGTAAGWERIHL